MARMWIAGVLVINGESVNSCGFSNKWQVWIAVVFVINGESVDSCGFSSNKCRVCG
jgi:hypothetical protein